MAAAAAGEAAVVAAAAVDAVAVAVVDATDVAVAAAISVAASTLQAPHSEPQAEQSTQLSLSLCEELVK